MTTLFRQRTLLTGFPGGPGVATMYFLDVNTAIESVSKLWSTLSNNMPTDVFIAPQRTGDSIEDTTGALVGSWSGGVSSASQGANSGAYAAPAGAVLSWRTGTVLDGKRVRGRTFVVPLGAGAYESNGSLIVGFINSALAAGNQFILEQGASAVIWHRPYKGRAATATRPARPAHLGGHGLITECRVPDLAAVLRSRRD